LIHRRNDEGDVGDDVSAPIPAGSIITPPH
jgi:hypothetical protein